MSTPVQRCTAKTRIGRHTFRCVLPADHVTSPNSWEHAHSVVLQHPWNDATQMASGKARKWPPREALRMDIPQSDYAHEEGNKNCPCRACIHAHVLSMDENDDVKKATAEAGE